MTRSLTIIGLVLMLAVLLQPYALAQTNSSGNTTPKQIVPIDCDPALPPSDGGCGLPAFHQLIQNIIDWLLVIIFSVATAVIAYGGFVIMSSGGSSERISKGKQAIKAGVIGIAIALGSFIIVKLVFAILGVQPEFTPDSLEGNI